MLIATTLHKACQLTSLLLWIIYKISIYDKKQIGMFMDSNPTHCTMMDSTRNGKEIFKIPLFQKSGPITKWSTSPKRWTKVNKGEFIHLIGIMKFPTFEKKA